MDAIAFSKVTKDFRTDFWKRKVRALEDVTFSVGEGEIFGLIGPNGAGKTTALKILMGLIQPTEGAAFIRGRPASDVRAKRDIGYLPENAYYYDFLRTEEVTDFYGRLFGLGRAERKRRTEELLALVGLADRRGIRLRGYSKGMLQRIGIAQALVNDPRIVILDEPMSGLDPIGRHEMREIILRLGESGKTVLFSSHILSDVEAVCRRVAILIHGRLQAFGAIEDLVHARIKSVEIEFSGSTKESPPPDWMDVAPLRRAGDSLIVRLTDPAKVDSVIDWGRGAGLSLVCVSPQKETLEDLFLEKARAG